MFLYSPKMRILVVFLLLMSMLTISCEKAEDLSASVFDNQVSIDAIGGEHTFDLKNTHWRIAGVINNDANVRLFGDIKSLDGDLKHENTLISLDELGIIESSTNFRSFKIVRNDLNSFKIVFQENKQQQPFNITILIESELGTHKIMVSQQKSAGYEFKDIDFFIGDGDGDSIYVVNNVMTYKFNFLNRQTIQLFPLSSQNAYTSYFKSDNPEAFSWLSDTTRFVHTPEYISDDNVYLSDQVLPYGELSKIPFKSDEQIDVDAPKGLSSYSIDLFFRSRKLSYRITLQNKQTGELKQILGKWYELKPSGEYKINRN